MQPPTGSEQPGQPMRQLRLLEQTIDGVQGHQLGVVRNVHFASLLFFRPRLRCVLARSIPCPWRVSRWTEIGTVIRVHARIFQGPVKSFIQHSLGQDEVLKLKACQYWMCTKCKKKSCAVSQTEFLLRKYNLHFSKCVGRILACLDR